MGKTVLSRLLIIASESDPIRKLSSELTQKGFNCLITPYNDKTVEQITRQSFDLVLVHMDESIVGQYSLVPIQRTIQENKIPIIALVSSEKLESLDVGISIDDFAVSPWEATELVVRIKRVLGQKARIESKDSIKSGDLVIDPVRYEVSIGGKSVVLTFKEYQLLKFLASNQGEVFTREALLNKVWGYDYYGGDRTVDVHIRRLRSKIEDRDHSFIDTIRNIGYRFKESY